MKNQNGKNDKGRTFKYLAGGTGVLVCYCRGAGQSFTPVTAAVPFGLIRRMQTGHPVRHRDRLFGIQAVGQSARQLICKIVSCKEHFYYLIFVL